MSRPARFAGRRSSSRSSGLRRAPSGEPSSRLSISSIGTTASSWNRRWSRRQSGSGLRGRLPHRHSRRPNPLAEEPRRGARERERAGDPDDRRRPGHHRAKQTDERLRDAERRYRTLVEQLPLASYVEQLDERERRLHEPADRRPRRLHGRGMGGRHDFFAKRASSRGSRSRPAGFAAMHETGEQFECEYRLIARDGRVVWIHDAAVVVRDEAGSPLYAQGYMIDITERKRNEEALLREPGPAARADAEDRVPGAPRRPDRPAEPHALPRPGRAGVAARRSETAPASR